MFHLRIRFALPSLHLAALLALGGMAPAGAKSPEEFVGGEPAAKTAPPGKPKTTRAVAAGLPAAAVGAVAPMDTAKIHGQYLEGDFDQAIRALEAQLKTRRPMSHAESVFVFKHLGVMYAAQHSTRDKGKFYMQELISIEPTAKILDMYASDMIHLIFRNVQEEFEQSRRSLSGRGEPQEGAPAASAQPAEPALVSGPAKPAPAEEESRPAASNRRRNILFATAGAGVAVGALTLFFVLGDDGPKTRTIVVNE
jgi:hypothetical protein